MNYLLDTNIILIYLRSDELFEAVEKKYNLLSRRHNLVVSVVSVGEIKSLALQRGWGTKRITQLNNLLSNFLIADINTEQIIGMYAEIDAFSQGKLPSKPLNKSSRNMGKNDLWISATAAVLDLQLITTDLDFNHLHNFYFNVELVNLKKLM